MSSSEEETVRNIEDEESVNPNPKSKNQQNVIKQKEIGTRGKMSKDKSKQLEKRQNEKKRYHSMTPEQKAAKVKRAAERRNRILQSETTEEKAARLAKNREQAQIRQSKMKPEERAARNKKKVDQQKQKRLSETPEETAVRLAKQKEYARIRKSRMKPGEFEEREKKYSESRKRNFANLTPEAKEAIRIRKRKWERERYRKNSPTKNRAKYIGKKSYENRKARARKKYHNLSRKEKEKLKERKRMRLSKLTPNELEKYRERQRFLDRWRIRTKSKRLAKAVEIFNQKLTGSERISIEKNSRMGAMCEKWHEVRLCRITGTTAACINKRKRKDPWDLADRLKRKHPAFEFNYYPCLRGIALEETAKDRYVAAKDVKTGCLQYPVGFIIHAELNYIGATPDCLVTEVDKNGKSILGVVEIKSPMSPICEIAKRTSGNRFVVHAVGEKRGKFFVGPIKPTKQNFMLNRKHKYFDQICVQMICSDRHFGDFVVFFQNDNKPTEFELWIERIWRDEIEDYWNLMKPKLIDFYRTYMINPRPANLPSSQCPDHPKNLKRLLSSLSCAKTQQNVLPSSSTSTPLPPVKAKTEPEPGPTTPAVRRSSRIKKMNSQDKFNDEKENESEKECDLYTIAPEDQDYDEDYSDSEDEA